jgi:nicotinamide-nucleotide amidase
VAIDDLDELARVVGEVLLERRMKLAVAESCTGGWVAKVATDIAGSSRWFDRGFVCYSNESKQDMLGVSARTLEESGAVSEAAVLEMASGVLAHSLADVAAAISGIAGPGGETPGKPLGMVCFAWLGRGGARRVRTEYFTGDRGGVREQAVKRALEGVLGVIRES